MISKKTNYLFNVDKRFHIKEEFVEDNPPPPPKQTERFSKKLTKAFHNLSELLTTCHTLSVGEVESGTGPKDEFDGSAQVYPPCEDNVNGGLVDGLVEGRNGVQVETVESEVLVICEGNNKEGACDTLC